MTRVVVISGGGTGIGRATAAEFARCGDQVVIVGRRGDVLEEAAAAIGEQVPGAPKVTALRADMSDPGDVERFRADLERRYGRVDVLGNNAGGNIELHDDRGGDGPARTAERWPPVDQRPARDRERIIESQRLSAAV